MGLEKSVLQGGVGAILVGIGSVFPIIGIVGVVLMLAAFKGLAEYYSEDDIFRSARYGLIIYMIGVIALSAVGSYAIFAWFVRVMAFFSKPSTIIGPKSFMVPLLGGLIIAVLIMFVCYLIGALPLKRSLEMLSEKSGENLFSVAGLMLFIGAAATIIVIGAIIIMIAWVITAIAFSSLKPKPQTTQQSQASQPMQM
ncbi:MAG: DUF996 domain-containing protein [Candidatus Bathyarchaeia archaeon]